MRPGASDRPQHAGGVHKDSPGRMPHVQGVRYLPLFSRAGRFDGATSRPPIPGTEPYSGEGSPTRGRARRARSPRASGAAWPSPCPRPPERARSLSPARRPACWSRSPRSGPDQVPHVLRDEPHAHAPSWSKRTLNGNPVVIIGVDRGRAGRDNSTRWCPLVEPRRLRVYDTCHT